MKSNLTQNKIKKIPISMVETLLLGKSECEINYTDNKLSNGKDVVINLFGIPM